MWPLCGAITEGGIGDAMEVQHATHGGEVGDAEDVQNGPEDSSEIEWDEPITRTSGRLRFRPDYYTPPDPYREERDSDENQWQGQSRAQHSAHSRKQHDSPAAEHHSGH